jgi:hypothetical protein
MQEDRPEDSGQILKRLKWHLFDLFFWLNLNKFSFGIQYYIIVQLIEAMQFMTLVLVDGQKSEIGPYEDDSPWNLEQT